MGGNLSKELKEKIIEIYNMKPITLQEMSDRFSLCYVTISKILKEYKIPMYTKQQLFSYGLDEDYFENIDSEEKAYLLGFFMADGCIYNGPHSEISKVIFGLKLEDKLIVDIFHNAINAQTNLRYDNRGTGFVSCVVSSDKMANDLINIGVNTYKKDRTFPKLQKHLYHHYIRGFFDGDGSFGYRLSHPERKNCNSYSGRIDIIIHLKMKDPLINILSNDIGISNICINKANVKCDGMCCIDIFRKNDILKFYKYIYDEHNLCLDRKRNKFEEFFRLNNIKIDGTEIT